VKHVKEENKMKIGVATENGFVSGHFGKCEQFTIFETEGKEAKSKTLLDTKAQGHALLPPFLAANGVETVIAGGMGDGARQKLESLGIDIISGASGKVDDVLTQYLEGTLKVSEGGCHSDHRHGEHHCSCHGH